MLLLVSGAADHGMILNRALPYFGIPGAVPAVLQLVREKVSGAQICSIARNLRAISEG
jgi:hypothetical protein